VLACAVVSQDLLFGGRDIKTPGPISRSRPRRTGTRVEHVRAQALWVQQAAGRGRARARLIPLRSLLRRFEEAASRLWRYTVKGFTCESIPPLFRILMSLQTRDPERAFVAGTKPVVGWLSARLLAWAERGGLTARLIAHLYGCWRNCRLENAWRRLPLRVRTWLAAVYAGGVRGSSSRASVRARTKCGPCKCGPCMARSAQGVGGVGGGSVAGVGRGGPALAGGARCEDAKEGATEGPKEQDRADREGGKCRGAAANKKLREGSDNKTSRTAAEGEPIAKRGAGARDPATSPSKRARGVRRATAVPPPSPATGASSSASAPSRRRPGRISTARLRRLLDVSDNEDVHVDIETSGGGVSGPADEGRARQAGGAVGGGGGEQYTVAEPYTYTISPRRGEAVGETTKVLKGGT